MIHICLLKSQYVAQKSFEDCNESKSSLVKAGFILNEILKFSLHILRILKKVVVLRALQIRDPYPSWGIWAI